MREIDDVDSIIYNIRYEYHTGVTTVGNCSLQCGGRARGSGVCSDCCEKRLAEMTTPSLAKRLHSAIKDQHKILCEIGEYIEESERKDD